MKRFLIEFGLGMAAYAIFLIVSLRLLVGGIDDQVLRTAVSLLPIIPCGLICWAIVRQLRHIDEMQRTIQIEALAIAFAATALLTFSYGFLENVGFPKLSMFAVWPLMSTFWVIGLLITQSRYR